jgi:molybdate transport system substrate-binding protein
MGARIKVFSGNGLSASFAELLPRFERAHDCSVEMRYAPAQVTLREIKAGETADLGILGSSVMDEVVALGKITPDSVKVLTRNGVGVGVLAGAPKPDLSSVESFKRMLLNAKSVAYTTDGASGIYFAGLIERLGIANEVKAKARTRSGGLIAEFVASGDAEIAVQQIPEIMAVAGVDYAGPLPPEIQSITVAKAGIFTDAKEPVLAQRLLHYLLSPDAARVYKSRGLEPVAT